MNRRDFFDPRRLAQTAGAAYAAAKDLSAPAAPSDLPDQLLIRYARRAMATQFEVVLPFGTPHALPAAEAALDLIDQLEEQLSVYRETSEVSRINRRAVEEEFTVEPRLFDLLT